VAFECLDLSRRLVARLRRPPRSDKTGRACRGVELDPLYVEVILRRYVAATGNPAILFDTGETFKALALRRVTEAVAV
jgi:hypothetical protein